MSEQADLRIGLIGAGRWGSNYLRALPRVAGLRLASVCDPDPAARARVSAIACGVGVVADLDALLSAVDAVVVAAPSELHATLALTALEAGKHVLVEKPLATDLAHARTVIERAASLDRTLAVAHLTLMHPAMLALREVLSSGELGRVDRIEVTRTSDGARYRHDSPLWSLAPHDLANVLFVTGGRDARVRDAWERGDEAALQLDLSGGIVARMRWSRAASVPERTLHVVGSRGAARFDETSGRLEVLGASRVVLADGQPEPGLLDRLCSHFLGVIRGEAPHAISEAFHVVRILEAAQRTMDAAATAQKLSAAV